MDVIGYIIIILVVVGFAALIGVAKRSINQEQKTTSITAEKQEPSKKKGYSRVQVSKQKYKKTMDLEWLKERINVDEKHLLRLSMGYQVTIPDGHELELFSRIKVTRESRKTIKVAATLKKVFPSYLDIRPSKSSYGVTKDTFSILDLNKYFKFYSTAPDMWREVFKNTIIVDSLQQNSMYIEYYYVRGEYMEAVVSYDEAAFGLLKMTSLIHQGLKELFGVLDNYEVEKLICYNCQDPFDPLEEVCDKCGSPRPRCIVCLLDLVPSEIDEEIVTTPCCGVYTHKDHILMWLRQNPNCPNCHENLSHWLGKLQMA